jgi:hypothetical protein
MLQSRHPNALSRPLALRAVRVSKHPKSSLSGYVQNTGVILVKRDDASYNCQRVRCGFLLSQKWEWEGTDSSIFFALSTQNSEIIA